MGTSKPIIGVSVAVAIAAIAACTTPQQRAQQAVADFGPACETLGAVKGTDQWRQCVLTMYQQAQSESAQRRAAAGALGAAILANQPKPPAASVPMTCRWVGPVWSCQ